MAKKGNTVIVKLRSSESEYRYYTTKNKKNTTGRMEIKKYDPLLRKHVAFKEERWNSALNRRNLSMFRRFSALQAIIKSQ